MDKIMESRFDRVEKSLSTLIASISTYNPSPPLAHDLFQADQSLSDGLSLLTRHQSNHTRIQTLQTLSKALDSQIHSLLLTLTETRKNLLATPATPIQKTTEQRGNLNYSDLLDYARRISKFTLPSNFRSEQSISALPSNYNTQDLNTSISTMAFQDSGLGEKLDVDYTITKDVNAPTPTPTPTPLNSSAEPAGAGAGAAKHLPPHLNQWLDPHREYVYVPWPSEQVIRRGALAMIQPLVVEGRSLEGWEAEREAGEREGEMRRVEEEVGVMKAEEVRRVSFAAEGLGNTGVGDGGRPGQGSKEGKGGTGERREQGRRQFSLDELEDEDDEDDD